MRAYTTGNRGQRGCDVMAVLNDQYDVRGLDLPDPASHIGTPLMKRWATGLMLLSIVPHIRIWTGVKLRVTRRGPKTLTEHGGASVLVGNDIGKISHAFHQLAAQPKRPHRPELRDGKTAHRIVERIVQTVM